MNTGLLTFYHIHHYGAALQAFALQRAVERLGSACEIMDYYVNQNNALFRLPVTPGAAAADAHTALHYPALKTRYRRFQDFTASHLHLTDCRYESMEELQEAALPYDLLLCGSDQIWNPSIFPDRRFDPVFFGAFSPARKAAYAPSFGIPKVPEGMEVELRAYLSAFSHLSAREPPGQDIIHGLTGRDAPVVLDPTLLLSTEEWTALSRYPASYPAGYYLLVYCISDPAPLRPYVRALAEANHLKVIQLCGTRRKVVPGAKCILDAGPAEFLGLFQHASMVVTNSFHGTVFSLHFRKPFFSAVSPAEREKAEQSRIYALLHPLGLSDRIVGTGRTASPDTPVPWAEVSEALKQARDGSLSFLKAAVYNQPYEDTQTGSTEPAPLPRLASRQTCTGCTACMSICPKDAIRMERGQEGFSCPVVDTQKCVKCGRCTGVCPPLQSREPLASAPAVFAAWNRDTAVRRESSSGGVFSVLAESVLEDGGVVFGAAFGLRQHVEHTACFRKEDLWRLRGAKYVQSDLGRTFRDVRHALKTRPVLFSGTPCQVDGLYRFLGSRPENLITCDIVCHGVPSPGVWEDWAAAVQKQRGAEVRSVRFRDKTLGWKQSRLTLDFADGRRMSGPLYETEFGRAFGRNLFLRRCCHGCAYASLNRPGDFTLGDFWGLKPTDLPDEQLDGVSLLLVNTPHGSRVFDRLPLECRPGRIECALSGNPNLSAPTKCPALRTAFFAAYAVEPFEQVRKEFLSLPPVPVRLAKKLLSPELRERLRRKKKT